MKIAILIPINLLSSNLTGLKAKQILQLCIIANYSYLQIHQLKEKGFYIIAPGRFWFVTFYPFFSFEK